MYVYIYYTYIYTLSKNLAIRKAAARSIRNLLNTKSFSKMEKNAYVLRADGSKLKYCISYLP